MTCTWDKDFQKVCGEPAFWRHGEKFLCEHHRRLHRAVLDVIAKPLAEIDRERQKRPS